MGRRPDSMLSKRKIVIGMLTAGMINKQIVRDIFKLVSLRYPVLEHRSVRWAVSKIENHADRSRNTTMREDIDKVTSFRRNRFLSRARLPTGLVRNATGLGFVPNSSKPTEGYASALTSPIRWCSVNYLHKCVRLNWVTTHCRCILDDIGMKLLSRKTNETARHFFN